MWNCATSHINFHTQRKRQSVSLDNWISVFLAIIAFVSICAGYASLFDDDYPNARTIARAHRKQKADLRRALGR